MSGRRVEYDCRTVERPSLATARTLPGYMRADGAKPDDNKEFQPMRKRTIGSHVGSVFWSLGVVSPQTTRAEDPLTRQNVVWDAPSKNSSGSMPIGNGDIGLNVWAEPNGDVVFLIGKTDAWSENARLLKLGRVRVRFSPNPLADAGSFRQELRLRQGEIAFRLGEGPNAIAATLWVDANRPVVHLDAESPSPIEMRATLEVWRTARRELEGPEADSAYGLDGGPNPIVVSADTIVDGRKDQVVWYHHNARSIWAANLKHQGLESFQAKGVDPLLGRTFGGCLQGEGLVSDNPTTLRSAGPRKRFSLRVYPLTAMAAEPNEWLARLERSIQDAAAVADEKAIAEHRAWWDEFWNRSWIRVSGTPEADVITRGYTLQRWITACGRPRRVPDQVQRLDLHRRRGRPLDPDYRRWGGPYWWQNTRLPYWPHAGLGRFRPDAADVPHVPGVAAAGRRADPGLVRPRRRVRARDDVLLGNVRQRELRLGPRRTGRLGVDQPLHPPRVHGLARADGHDARLLRLHRGRIVPRRDALADVRRAAGVLGQALPAGRGGPARDVSGPGAGDLPGRGQPDARRGRAALGARAAAGIAGGSDRRRARAFWTRLLAAVPPLPMGEENGEKVILPAGKVFGGAGNSENPELYAVFPFRLYGVGKPDLDVARRTFAKRKFRGPTGWRQDDTQAAFLGLTDEAAGLVAARAASRDEGSRFPAFWGPNFDWIPDQDHGGNLMMALETMLLQADGGKILVLPAWPKAWDVEFKLHAPGRTTVEGVYRSGKLESLDVTPDRAVEVCLPYADHLPNRVIRKLSNRIQCSTSVGPW